MAEKVVHDLTGDKLALIRDAAYYPNYEGIFNYFLNNPFLPKI